MPVRQPLHSLRVKSNILEPGLVYIWRLPYQLLFVRNCHFPACSWGRCAVIRKICHQTVPGLLDCRWSHFILLHRLFGVVIDKEMLRNAVVTTPREAVHLVTPQFIFYVFFYGVFPSLLICLTEVRHRPILGKLFVNFIVTSACLIICVSLTVGNYAAISSDIRQNREMIAKLTPFAPITSAIGLAVSAYREIGIVRVPIGTDAKLGPAYARTDKPVVTIIVAGETARAMNFSLKVYERETNPELKALNVVNYTKTTSCGTATAVSSPCMFSVYGRKDYSDRKARSTDTLMDVLRRAGIDDYWWDNNTGSKGIADLVNFASLTKQKDSPLCKDGECLDDRALNFVDNNIRNMRTVV